MDDNNVWGGKIAAGVSTQLNYGFLRTELEYSRNEDAKSTTGAKKGGTDFTKLESQSLMLNAYTTLTPVRNSRRMSVPVSVIPS